MKKVEVAIVLNDKTKVTCVGYQVTIAGDVHFTTHGTIQQ